MSKRFPPWLVVPLSLLAAVGVTWAVGALQDIGAKKAGASQNPYDATILGKLANGDQSHPSFPDFNETAIDGSSFKLSDHRGQVLLINFWATWCGPCKEEIPDLISLQKKYGPKGFTVVGMSEDQQFDGVAPFVKMAGMNYPVMKTPDGLSRTLGVMGLPTSVLVDKQGKIVTAMSGVDPQKSMAGLWGPQIESAL